jgi:c-di-GMP-binding flagellar brake protein YcgR
MGQPVRSPWSQEEIRVMEERRKHERYKAAEEVIAVSGGIPCSLVDLSQGGLGLKYAGDESLPEEMKVDLMFLSRDLHLSGIRCRKISDEKVTRTTVFSYVTERRIGLEFTDVPEATWEVLEEFRGVIN